VLITGGRAPITLHLCRALEEGGIDVYIADSVFHALAKSSRCSRDFFLYPSPKFEPHRFIECLIKIIKNREIDVLIPTCEEIFYISMFRRQLSLYCDVFVDDFDKLKLLHHKESFIQFVDRLGFEIPKTSLLSPQLDRLFIQKEFPGQIVLKKAYSRFSDSVSFYKSSSELPNYVFTDSSWLIQERIVGTQYCSYGVSRNGKLLAHSVYKSEFTAGLGATLTFEYSEKSDIEQFVRKIVEKLSFTGQISFDFIVNQAGEAIPIECNPRATSGLHLFGKEIANVMINDFHATLYPKRETKEAIKLGVLLYGIKNLKTINQVKRLFQVLFTYKDTIYQKNDKSPFFYQFISMYDLWKVSRKNQVNLLEQSTYDISWDGEEV
jgi:predicted ATP-grasp superfamily ATP-dependent carboligase